MLSYLINRLLEIIPVLFTITLLGFLVFHFDTADPTDLLTREANISDEAQQLVRERLGLDKPVHIQYFHYINRLLHADLGKSYRSQRAVVEHLAPAIRATAYFMLVALFFTVALGIPAGIYSATRPYTLADNIVTACVLVGVSAPEFWIGILLIWLFAYQLGWFPTSGYFTWQSVILPALTLALHYGAIVARVTRTGILEVLSNDYIRTARAKGLSQRSVFYKHALRNASLPIVTVISLQTAHMMAGTLILENVFAWPGIGRLLVVAILERDMPVVQGCILVIAIGVLALNALTDVLYSLLDPTVRYHK